MNELTGFEDKHRARLAQRLVVAASGCIEWSGARNKEGYGYLRIGKRMMRVHRLAWALERGSIPEGLCVLHRCDNPPCTNLDHLFLGTKKTNNSDRASKGRNHILEGERSPYAQLTNAQAKDVRLSFRSGYCQRCLATHFNVAPSTIENIRRGLCFKRAGGPVVKRRPWVSSYCATCSKTAPNRKVPFAAPFPSRTRSA